MNGKSISYYKNGMPSQSTNYVNGIENGLTISYRENGTKKLIGFFLNSRPMGDVYFFDTLNRIQQYEFLDFNKNALMVCKYDSSGKVLNGVNRDFYLFDSLKVIRGKNGTDTIKTMFLISHQPKTSLKVRIDNIGSDGSLINSKNIDADYQLGFSDIVINKDVDTIKEIGVRYDSVLNDSYTFIIVRLTKNLK